jgi:hypothetical protein
LDFVAIYTTWNSQLIFMVQTLEGNAEPKCKLDTWLLLHMEALTTDRLTVRGSDYDLRLGLDVLLS